MKTSKIIDIKSYYDIKDIAKSFLLGFLFFIFPAAILSTYIVLTILLSYRYLLYFVIGLLILLNVLSAFSNKITIQTLKAYRDLPDIFDYHKLYIRLCILSSVILLFLFGIGIYFLSILMNF